MPQKSKKEPKKKPEVYITKALVKALLVAPGNVSVTFAILGGRVVAILWRGGSPKCATNAVELETLFKEVS